MKSTVNLIKNNDIKPKKRLGQNFLTNDDVISKIVSATDLSEKNVIEIGPGLGAITKKLVEKVKSIEVYEIDEELIQVLRNELKSSKLVIHNIDFLKAKFEWDDKKIVFGNIPYFITSKIIFKIFNECNKFSKMILMIQKDVADKMMSKINTKKYGKLAITCNFYGGVKRILDVDKKHFYPAPKVDSTVIMIDFAMKRKIANDKEFVRFIKSCFLFRRKTIFNNLKINFNKEKINLILNKVGINPTDRPQTISIDSYIKLWEGFNNE